mgnify:CR=1 FL=1
MDMTQSESFLPIRSESVYQYHTVHVHCRDRIPMQICPFCFHYFAVEYSQIKSVHISSNLSSVHSCMSDNTYTVNNDDSYDRFSLG